MVSLMVEDVTCRDRGQNSQLTCGSPCKFTEVSYSGHSQAQFTGFHVWAFHPCGSTPFSRGQQSGEHRQVDQLDWRKLDATLGVPVEFTLAIAYLSILRSRLQRCPREKGEEPQGWKAQTWKPVNWA